MQKIIFVIALDILIIIQYFCSSVSDKLLAMIKRNKVPDIYIKMPSTTQKLGDKKMKCSWG